MCRLSRIFAAFAFVLAGLLVVAAPLEAGGLFARRAIVAPIVVAQPQAFVLQQRVVVPRQRIVVAPQAIVVPQAFSVPQTFVTPQAFSFGQSVVAPVQSFSSGGCGAFLVR